MIGLQKIAGRFAAAERKDNAYFLKSRKRIFMKLINTQRNQKLLEMVPHIPYLDMSIVFYVPFCMPGRKMGTALVQESNPPMGVKGLLKLYDTALKNTINQRPAKLVSTCQNLADAGLWPDYREDTEKVCERGYILSNQTREFGAAVLLYPRLLEAYASKYGCDWLVLPWSVHEIQIQPFFSEEDVESSRRMIKDLHLLTLKKENILSDRLYIYRRKSGRLVEV